MSEPSGLFIKVILDEAQLRGALQTGPGMFDDWAVFDPGFENAPERSDTRTFGDLCAELRQYAVSGLLPGWRFSYDVQTGELDCVKLYWSENYYDMRHDLEVVRKALQHATGFALIHNYVFGNEYSLGAIRFADGASIALPDSECGPYVEQARPVHDELFELLVEGHKADPPLNNEAMIQCDLDQWWPIAGR